LTEASVKPRAAHRALESLRRPVHTNLRDTRHPDLLGLIECPVETGCEGRASGWDLEEVSARLGHSDVGTTQRAYVHAYDAAKRSDSRRERLAQVYSSAEIASEEQVVEAVPTIHSLR